MKKKQSNQIHAFDLSDGRWSRPNRLKAKTNNQQVNAITSRLRRIVRFDEEMKIKQHKHTHTHTQQEARVAVRQ